MSVLRFFLAVFLSVFLCGPPVDSIQPALQDILSILLGTDVSVLFVDAFFLRNTEEESRNTQEKIGERMSLDAQEDDVKIIDKEHKSVNVQQQAFLQHEYHQKHEDNWDEEPWDDEYWEASYEQDQQDKTSVHVQEHEKSKKENEDTVETKMRQKIVERYCAELLEKDNEICYALGSGDFNRENCPVKALIDEKIDEKLSDGGTRTTFFAILNSCDQTKNIKPTTSGPTEWSAFDCTLVKVTKDNIEPGQLCPMNADAVTALVEKKANGNNTNGPFNGNAGDANGVVTLEDETKEEDADNNTKTDEDASGNYKSMKRDDLSKKLDHILTKLDNLSKDKNASSKTQQKENCGKKQDCSEDPK